jgi:hypothetical protein
MPLPKLADSQIEWVVQQVAAYIEGQRQTYARRAAPLNQNQKTAMQPFFPVSSLDSARVVVLSGERVSNPPFYPELHGAEGRAAAVAKPSRSFLALWKDAI